MTPQDTIIITGAAGFIGSYFAGFLNRKGFEKLILVDDFTTEEKWPNLSGKKFLSQINRDDFPEWWISHPHVAQYCFHLGARTDTTEMDTALLTKLNLDYSKTIFGICAAQKVPLIYASSAATYGDGAFGYSDNNRADLYKLQPLNPYGWSKHRFDLWAMEQTKKPPFFAGVKFFNVYGPNEYHKKRMASVVMHACAQARQGGHMTLFRSHNPAYPDGGQMRDFVYVADVAEMIFWMAETRPQSGLYNIGTGEARSFSDLAAAVFKALQMPLKINYTDTPADLRDKYQYFTEADMSKLRGSGYDKPFYSLEAGIEDYVTQYLVAGRYF